MESNRQITITVYDKTLKRLAVVGNPISMTVTERSLAMTSGQVTLEANDPVAALLAAPGARISIGYTVGDLPRWGDWTITVAKVTDFAFDFLPNGTVTFQFQDLGWSMLRNSPARVVPGSPLEAANLSDPGQSTNATIPPIGEDTGRRGYYFWSGSYTASHAVRDLVNANINDYYAARFGLINGISPEIEFPGYGYPGVGIDVTSILPQVRFGSVESYVVPLLKASKLGINFQTLNYDVGASLGMYFISQKTWPTTLTPESGIIRDGQASVSYPGATDVIVGGPGELTARAFFGASDTTGLSAKYRDIITVFRENTGAPLQWPTTLDEKFRIAKYFMLRPEISANDKAEFARSMQNAASNVLTDGLPKSGVSITLAESEHFRYTGDIQADFRGFATGDIVTIAPSQESALSGLTFTDQITETTISLSRDKGITVTPQVGQKVDDPDVQLALAVRALALANNRRSTNQ